MIKHLIKAEKYQLSLTFFISLASVFYFSNSTYSQLSIFASLSFGLAILLPLIWIHLIYPVRYFHHKSMVGKKYIFLEYLESNRYVIIFFIPHLFLLGSNLTVAFSLVLNFIFHFMNTALWFNNTGSSSIPWRTGKKGISIRTTALETGSVALPIGSIPSQIRTLGSVIFNVAFVYFSLVNLRSSNLFIVLIPLILVALFYIKTNLANFVGNHAFFDEYFKPDSISSVAKPVLFESLYWIPKGFRTDARFLLTQHIRSQSISRIHLGSHIIFWILALVNPVWFTTLYGLLSLVLLLIIESFQLFNQSNGSYYSTVLVKSFYIKYLTHLFCMIRWIPAYVVVIAYHFSFSNWVTWLLATVFIFLFQSILSLLSVLLLKQFSSKKHG